MRYVAMLAGLLALAAGAVRAADAPPRLISTSGDAIIYVVPDEAVVGFGVETFHKNLEEARGASDAAAARLVKAVKALGVEDKYIQNDRLMVEIVYKDNHAYQGIEGYLTRRFYSVVLKDTKKLDALLDAVMKNGANQLGGVEFRTTELRKHRDEARKLAIKAAAEKAAMLASQLECKLGKPYTINEGGEGYQVLQNAWANSAQNAEHAVGGGAEGGETTPMGQISIRATVSVSFDLLPIAP